MSRYTSTKIPVGPQSRDEIENLKKEKLKTLSLNFELDLIRLSKTVKLILQSENRSKEHLAYVEDRLREFHENLAALFQNALDLQEETSKLSVKLADRNDELANQLNTCIKDMIAIINSHLNYSRKIKDDLEKRTKDYIDELDSSRKVRGKELQELNSRLMQQQNNLSNTLFDISILDEEKSNLPNKPEAGPRVEKKPPHSLSDTASPFFKNLTITPMRSSMNSALKHKEITYLIMLVIFVSLFLMFFNDGRESKKTRVSSKQETVYSWEISKRENPEDEQLNMPRIQETKNPNEEEISKKIEYEPIDASTKTNGVKKETIMEPPSEKLILALTVPAANLRRGPNKKYPAASVVKSGDAVEKLGESGNWIKIKTESGDEGWIWKRLIREEFD